MDRWVWSNDLLYCRNKRARKTQTVTVHCTQKALGVGLQAFSLFFDICASGVQIRYIVGAFCLRSLFGSMMRNLYLLNWSVLCCAVN